MRERERETSLSFKVVMAADSIITLTSSIIARVESESIPRFGSQILPTTGIRVSLINDW